MHLPCLERSRVLTAVTFVYRGAPLTDISLNWPTVGSMCQANNPSCPPRIAPKATATIMARVAFSMASVVLVKWMGAVHANMATLTVSVNKMDTVVLMATIWPNLAKGPMTQKRRGDCRDCCGDSAGHYGNAYMVDSLQGAPPLLTGMLQQKQNSFIWSAASRPSDSNQLKNPVI